MPTNRHDLSVISNARPDGVRVVNYTDDPAIQSAKKFTDAGLPIGAGVSLQYDEPDDFKSFRIGLFGLDKLHNIERTVDTFAKALNSIV